MTQHGKVTFELCVVTIRFELTRINIQSEDTFNHDILNSGSANNILRSSIFKDHTSFTRCLLRRTCIAFYLITVETNKHVTYIKPPENPYKITIGDKYRN